MTQRIADPGPGQPAVAPVPVPAFGARAARALPAPAKLNLFLHVNGRRDDGYHLLETVFRFVDLCDEIDLHLRDDARIVRTAGPADVAPESDLAVRAAHALREAAGVTVGADIAVRKRIPAGGGLGGGSSDAATVLIGLNRLWGIGFGIERLAAIGLALGADVPVFVRGTTAHARGIGERLTPIALPPARYLVAWPGVGIATKAIFEAPGLTRNTPIARISGSADTLAIASGEFGRNDLERVVVASSAQVQAALDWLGTFGPARMTGSGACCFVRFDGDDVPVAPEGLRVWHVAGLDTHPMRHWVDRTDAEGDAGKILGSRQAG